MSSSLLGLLAYALVPTLALVLGGVVAAYRPPRPKLRSLLQHLAAGVVFAAVAGELLPQELEEHRPLPVVLGFAAGVGLMLGIRTWTERAAAAGGGEGSRGLLVTLGVDIVVDGLLIGIAFAAGAETGLLLTAALTLEVLFLGLVAGTALGRGGGSRGSAIAVVAGLGALLVGGTLVGGILLGGLTGDAFLGVLAFGSAALLYLVIEELLLEAHDVPETPVSTAMFFVGFLVIFVIEMVV